MTFSPDLYAAFDELWATALQVAAFVVVSAAIILFALCALAAIIDRSKSRRPDERAGSRRGAML